MAFRLHVRRPPELALVHGLFDLARSSPSAGQVFLAKNPHGEGHFLMSTDGTVVRSQLVRLFWGEKDLREHHQSGGPCTPDSPLSAWLQDDGLEPLPDLATRPARLVPVTRGKGDRGEVWDLVFPDDDDKAGKVVSLLLLQHLRPIPEAFRSWLVIMAPRAMAAFAASFPPGLEPPVLWIPEPQPDPVKPGKLPTWAKYWGFHAKTAQPVGVIMGLRSHESLARFGQVEK